MSDGHSHVETHEEKGNDVVVEGEKHEQHKDETNAPINDEINHEKQHTVVENAD
ncbi:unnamed protein product, partial [Rotaria magnacalcarata]